MHLLERKYFGWGRTASRSASPQMGLVIHYDGPGQGLTEKPHSHCVEYWKGVRKFHMNSRGWADIGYSFGVCPHTSSDSTGYVFEGRGLYREQAAQPGGNTTYYSVTLMLGDGEHPTDTQIQTVRELREWLHDKTGNAETIKGHKDFYNTKCPGTILYGMVKDGTFSKAIGEDDVSAKEVWDEMIVTDKNADPQQKMPARTVLGHLEKEQDEIKRMLAEILAKLGG